MEVQEITELEQLQQLASELDLARAEVALRMREANEHKVKGFTSEADYIATTLDLNPTTARRLLADATMLSLADETTGKLIRSLQLSLDLVRVAYRGITKLPRKQRKEAFNQLIPTLVGKTFAEGKAAVAAMHASPEDPKNNYKKRSGRVSRDGAMTRLTGLFEGWKAAEIESAIADQVRKDHKGEDERRTPAQQTADAIHKLITTKAGSGPSSLAIIVPCDPAKLQSFLTNRGQELSPEDANQLVQAADRTWVHFVDKVTLQPLALGTTRRLATFAQRMELLLRQRSCIIPGCHHRADKCQVHHVKEWKAGGATDIDNLVFVCTGHHSLITAGHISLDADDTHWIIGIDGRTTRLPKVAQEGSAVDRLSAVAQPPPPSCPPQCQQE